MKTYKNIKTRTMSVLDNTAQTCQIQKYLDQFPPHHLHQ